MKNWFYSFLLSIAFFPEKPCDLTLLTALFQVKSYLKQLFFSFCTLVQNYKLLLVNNFLIIINKIKTKYMKNLYAYQYRFASVIFVSNIESESINLYVSRLIDFLNDNLFIILGILLGLIFFGFFILEMRGRRNSINTNELSNNSSSSENLVNSPNENDNDNHNHRLENQGGILTAAEIFKESIKHYAPAFTAAGVGWSTTKILGIYRQKLEREHYLVSLGQ